MNINDRQLPSTLVLVVDDDQFMRIQLRRAMEQAGYQVAEASDGEQALAVYNCLHPDIILLDSLMPVMDGFSCCRQLQTLPSGDRTPVLMITALEDRESVDRAFAAGATDYITQPVHWAILHQRVRYLLQVSRATMELQQQTEQARQTEEQLRLALEELQRQNRRSQLFADITLKIRQSLQLKEILQTTALEVQKLLGADRVLIFRLWPNGFGQIVTEAVVPDFPAVVGQKITDDCFGPEYLKNYRQGRIYTIADLEKASVQPCLVEFMQKFNVKAKLVMPILLKEELWGLMIVHQCTSPRQWSSFEIELLQQLADQIGVALAQAQLLETETQQRQELIRSNTELQQFAYIASHDLQEPLRKIQAFSTRLKEKCGEALTEPGRDYVERMQNAAKRMQALINDLLILSQVTTKAQPFVPVSLAQVAREVLSDLELQIQQTKGFVSLGELPTIDADPLQMRQLLQNLISNALKFHRPESPPVVKLHSQILVHQEQRPGSGATIAELYRIIVEDNGIGFDEKYLDRIFNAFQRLHIRRDYEGTGMGLAICRKIAERHGGSITAKSQLGRGARFMITLPSKQPRGEK